MAVFADEIALPADVHVMIGFVADVLRPYRMELAPASVTVLSYYETDHGRRTSMRLFNARPTSVFG